jgi:hypothetical protein
LIKANVILLNPPSQSIVLRVGLVNTNQLLSACGYRLPMADESLRITGLLSLNGVYNSRRRQ